MKTVWVFLVLGFGYSTAYDGIIWSSDPDVINNDLTDFIDSASQRKKLYLIAVDDFTPAVFKTQRPSEFVEKILSNPYKEIEVEHPIPLPIDDDNIQYIEASNLEDVDPADIGFGPEFVGLIGHPEMFERTARRVKRVGLIKDNDDDEEEEEEPRGRFRSKSKGSKGRGRSRNSKADLYFPVILPPYDSKKADPSNPDPAWGSCLLYLESVAVYVFDATLKKDLMGVGAEIGSDKSSGNKFAFSDDYVNCEAVKPVGEQWESQEFEFTIDVTPGKEVRAINDDKLYFSVDDPVSITLKFKTTPGHVWTLYKAVLNSGILIKPGTESWLSTDLRVRPGAVAINSSVSYLDMGAFYDYNYGCGNTRSAVFKSSNPKYEVGVAFGNVQIQPFGVLGPKGQVRFSTRTNDCVGTFSAGSWMGITVALVLGLVLIFGFLMLNSVQTVDRFDDPKRKQIVVNVKD